MPPAPRMPHRIECASCCVTCSIVSGTASARTHACLPYSPACCPAQATDVIEPIAATSTPGYRRDLVTWTAFIVLLAFGMLNAGLGPALPYLRRAEHVSYLASVLHPVAFAVGGGVAGLLTARARHMPSRSLSIRVGLLVAAAAWLAVGYGNRLEVTVCAAFAVSLLGTTALIRVWAVLADQHGAYRAAAMSEGEVAVS